MGPVTRPGQSRSGVVVLDTSCYKHLTDPAVRERLKRSLRSVDLLPWPSVVNVLEVISNPHRLQRERQIAVIRDLVDDRPLLPWAPTLLKNVGVAVAKNVNHIELGNSGVDWVLANVDRAAEQRDNVSRFFDEMETAFEEMHENLRQKVQAFLKERGLRNHWASAGEFLDVQWCTADLLEHAVKAIWSQIGVPGQEAPKGLIEAPAWRLFVEIEGIAVFQRAVLANRGRRVQRRDLLQVVYLGGFPRRVLTTADGPFLDATTALLSGRHGNARAIHIRDLVDLAGAIRGEVPAIPN